MPLFGLLLLNAIVAAAHQRKLSAHITVNTHVDSIANGTSCSSEGQSCNLRSAFRHCDENNVDKCWIILASDTMLTHGVLYISNTFPGSVEVEGNGHVISSNGTKCLDIERNDTTITFSQVIFSNCGSIDGGALDVKGPVRLRLFEVAFINNSHATAHAGPLVLHACDSYLSNCTFTNNNGAGVSIMNGNLTALSSTFTNNRGTSKGGAVYAHNSNVTLSNVEIFGNIAMSGGAVFAEGGTVNMREVFVSHNTATGKSCIVSRVHT